MSLPFEPETRRNTFAVFPTREFRFVCEPPCADRLSRWPYQSVAYLIRDLRALGAAGIQITLVIPMYLAAVAQRGVPKLLAEVTHVVTAGTDIPAFTIRGTMPSKARHGLAADGDEAERARSLLALADATQCDGIVTENGALIAPRWPLYQHHRMRMIPLEEFGGVVETCAHGHGIFWSATDAVRILHFDLYYHRTHPKCRKLTQWFGAIQGTLGADLHEHVRSALLNRYPFILYSRDMVRFYELQVDHFSRRGLYRRFGSALGYYITAFYLHVWGMLEQLTVIANRRLGLGLADEDCGIHKTRTFWKALRERDNGLAEFIRSEPVAAWIATMADVRHAAAHRAMVLPSALTTSTPESEFSDDEVKAKLREEDPEFYEVVSPEIAAALEPLRIWHWKMDHLGTVGENVVVLKGKSGTYVRGAVVSIDYDLTMLEAVMDAFIVAIFRKRDATA